MAFYYSVKVANPSGWRDVKKSHSGLRQKLASITRFGFDNPMAKKPSRARPCTLPRKQPHLHFPKSVRLPDGVTSVDIQRRGRSWVITPSEQSWAAWFDDKGVSSDFMMDREQPADQERVAL